ncbi:MAG: hypothetical protein V8R52_14015 [Coprobacter fastidiosus]
MYLPFVREVRRKGEIQFTLLFWQVDDAKYSVVSQLSSYTGEFQTYFETIDQIAAFINGECRGVAFIDNAFFITIKGTPEENWKILVSL